MSNERDEILRGIMQRALAIENNQEPENPEEPEGGKHMSLKSTISYNETFEKWVVQAEYMHTTSDGYLHSVEDCGKHICDSREEAIEWLIGMSATWVKLDEERRVKNEQAKSI